MLGGMMRVTVPRGGEGVEGAVSASASSASASGGDDDARAVPFTPS
ncbi:hypothetical protein HMPREF9057_01205 [Actinomyces sp. oral taxon 171 str. F0337]|nr:hypothetical protein HMPREF9057_01205 [Actinomyces sp. oral taxon 171 str. F0337]